MGKMISKYMDDLNVTEYDKVIGTDTDNNDATKNFGIGNIISLKDNQFVKVPLMFLYKTNDTPAASGMGIMNVDSVDILSATTITINRYSQNEEDISSYIIGLNSILSTYDVFLNIRSTIDGEVHGYFKVSTIDFPAGGIYILNGNIQDSLANGNFEDGVEYFLGQEIYKIPTASPETVQDVTWEQLLVYSPRRNGDRFNVAGSVDPATDYGYITLDDSDSFTIVNSLGEREIIIIA